MDAQYLAALEDTLQQTFSPTTVKQATARLSKELYSNALALPSLLHILQTSTQDQVKQLAAVEARKLVGAKWETVAAELKPQIRAALLQNTFSQPLKLIRHSSARVVAAIGDQDLVEDSWPELLPTLVAAVQDGDAQNKEMAVYTLYTLLETLCPALSAHQDDFVALFAGLVASGASQEIRVNAVACLDCLAQFLEQDDAINPATAAQFKAAIPGMLAVLQDVIQANDSDKTKAVFDVMNSLLFLDNQLVGEQIVQLISTIAELAANTRLDEEFRCMGLQFLISVVSLRKTKVSSNNLGPQLTAIATRIASEEIDVDDELNNEDEENENEENTPAALALRLMGVLAGELPPLQVIAPFFDSLPAMVASPDMFARRAGLLIVGVASAGAPDYLATQVAKIVPVLINGLQDRETVVQVAAVRAVAQLSSELQDNIADYHQQLLPLIMGIIDSAAHVMAYKYACYALDGIIEFMGHDAIAQYMAPLMQKLFSMLEAANSSTLKAAIVSAIGSTAFAGGKGFTPYFDQSIHILEPFISNAAQTDGMSEDDIELRACTFENISTMARAVGSEPFAAYAKPLVEAAYSSIGAEHPRIRESGFAFISNMAKVYGAEFAGFLDEIVPQILKCLEQEEFSFEGGEDDDEEEFEDDEGDMDNKFKFNSGITIEKEIASVALSELAMGTGAAFAKWVEPSFKTLSEQVEVSYGMREAAMNSLWKIVRAMFKATYGADFKAPKGVPQQSYLDANLLQLIEQARAITVANLEEEFEFNLVVCDLDNLTEALLTCGIAALVSNASDTSLLEKLCVQLMNILKKEHGCQLDDEEPVDEGEDTSESEAMLFESALEVLIILSLELGPDFVKIFASFKDVIIANVTSKSKSKRVSSIGGLAEISAGLKNANPYTDDFLQVFSDRLANDKSLEVKGNAAYGVGIIIEASSTDFSASYQQILQTMFHLLSKSDEQAKLDDGESKDVVNRSNANACGCVARMALKNAAAVPVEHVLPALLNHLPLESGPEENVPILTWIIKLYESGDSFIESQTERVIQILAEIFKKEADRLKLVEESTLGREENIEKIKQFHTKELEEKVVNLVKFLNQKYANIISNHEILKSIVA
ncbi:ARM repeat-containing protein [Metschnikowia bicuspidata var. bicuspidata NRRL YB-4993]|uniref:ARM repeat-containing protein n=1 Tax=Metschnikowia bicuspidata var. bicuspidata NRRL YB-4993 TaxID=869754 RepID=A0A1A0H9Y6_9ASCO|nr:ARM repeat-containing protein [Metschnikowia bicuspidata var. bicuspidata NRRL YB-4993]OBA20944.1 ARM repeat-containing protein [Metschnikowia bicuspidata var. bicuspidata NRRL YB-4993]